MKTEAIINENGDHNLCLASVFPVTRYKSAVHICEDFAVILCEKMEQITEIPIVFDLPVV